VFLILDADRSGGLNLVIAAVAAVTRLRPEDVSGPRIHASRTVAVAGGFGGKTSMLRRIEMIANHRVSHRLSWWRAPLLLVALAVLAGMPVHSVAAEPQLDQYPQAVQQSLRAEAADGRLLAVTEVSSEGRTLYRASVEIDGAQFDVVLGPNGRLLSKVFARVAPADEDEADDAALQDGDEDGDDKAARGEDDDDKAAAGKDDDDDDRKEAGGKDDDDDDVKEGKGKDDDDEKEAEGKDDDDRKDGDKEDDDGKNDDKDGDGEEGDQALKLSDLPASVRRTLKRESRGGEIEDLERETENGRVIYSADVEYETDDGELVYEVEIAENGTLLHKVLEQGDDDEDDDAKADDKEDRDDAKGDDRKDRDDNDKEDAANNKD
jgi:hypothetical protein